MNNQLVNTSYKMLESRYCTHNIYNFAFSTVVFCSFFEDEQLKGTDFSTIILDMKVSFSHVMKNELKYFLSDFRNLTSDRFSIPPLIYRIANNKDSYLFFV